MEVPDHHMEIFHRDYDRHFAYWQQRLDDHCDSPIELALGLAFVHISATHRGLMEFNFRGLESLTPGDFIDAVSLILPQQQIDRWRVDYLVVIRQYHETLNIDRMLVVECDGHDWHERTADQASRDKSRDRYFAERGIPVMRFTGREIWRDPLVCADQIVGAITNILTDWQAERLRLERKVEQRGDDE